MMRGYAIGLGAGTQALTLMVGSFLISQPSVLSGALLMGAGWVINLAVVRMDHPPAPPTRTAIYSTYP